LDTLSKIAAESLAKKKAEHVASTAATNKVDAV
jgi:hypothetical protein